MSFQDHTHNVSDKRAVILLSGGLDSAVAAALAIRMGWKLWALSIVYGQRHVHEVDCAAGLTDLLGIDDWRYVELDLTFLGTPLLSEEQELPIRTLEEIRKAEEASPAFLPAVRTPRTLLDEAADRIEGLNLVASYVYCGSSPDSPRAERPCNRCHACQQVEIERLRAGLRELLTNQPYPDHYPYAASVGRCTCRGCEIARRLLGEEK